MRKLLPTLLLACVGHVLPYAQTPTILEPGQIGIVGFVSDDKPNDGLNQSAFAFILLADVNPGTQIHFTDKGWNNRGKKGGGAFTTDEQILTWIASDTVRAGTIVIIEADSSAFYQPVGGRIVHGPGELDGEMLQLSHNGDQIFIFQGPASGIGEITLLGGLSINRGWGEDRDNPNQEHKSDLPRELQVDTTGTDTGSIAEPVPFVLDFPRGNAEWGVFRGSLAGTAAQIIRELNNRENWLTGRGIIDLLLELLPVELTDFRAIPEEAAVLLEWRTATELNNDFMAVERSPDGAYFTEIGRVPGKGTTYEPQSYSFSDVAPLDGLNYYRLRQVDFDGTMTYHRVLAVPFHTNKDYIQVFPNRAQQSLMVRLPAPNVQRTVWRIFDLGGRQQAAIPVGPGLTELELNIRHLAPGLYLLQIPGFGNREPVRFIKY